MTTELIAAGEAGDATVIPIHAIAANAVDDAAAALGDDVAAWTTANRFTGKLGQVLRVPDQSGGIRCILFGWGDHDARARDRFHLGDLARGAAPGTYRIETLPEDADAEVLALGWLLGGYRFDRYKSREAEEPAHLIAPQGVDPEAVKIVAAGMALTRDLINTPTSDLGPSALEAACRDLAERHGANIDVVRGDDLLTRNFPMIHAVGRAGAEAPRLIDLGWGDPGHPAVTLVGKGVCFDTGGLNIKPGQSMGLMKKDMGGAATVLGLAQMVMALGLPIRLRVLIPAVENAISGPSMRPGDVLTSRAGLTVEINNTDAEGRLVLADALTLATEDGAPDLLLDMATLTGAARVALGPEVIPFYTHDDALAADLADASSRVADPLWRLPLWPGYERDIEPEIADLDNAPKGGFAGSITAALFLARFADAARWVHFDIYGWTPAQRPGRPVGGECQAARAVLAVLTKRYGGRDG